MASYKDAQGRYLTRGLFHETISAQLKATGFKAPFTLKPYDMPDYKSLKKLYMEAEDPTEYTFAKNVFGEEGWEHWQKLKDAYWFKDHLEDWREELEIKLRSEGIKEMKKLADAGHKEAAKWIATGGWDTSKAGRPSKEKIKGELKRKTKIANDIHADAKRIGAFVVKDNS